MGNMSGSYGSHYTLWQSITENWTSVEGNYSNVTVRMYLTFDGSSYYAYTNNTTYGNMGGLGDYNIGSLNYSSGQYKDIQVAEWTGNVSHENDGSKYFSVSGYWNTDTSRIGSGSCSAGVWLSQIPRYTSVWISERGKTLESISVNWSTSDRRDWTQYSLNNGGWTDAGDTVTSDTSGYFTISGLTANTNYTVKIRVRRADSGLWSETGNITIRTKDIVRISSVQSFEFGNDAILSFINLENGNGKLNIKINDVEICTRDSLSSSYTLSFTKEELSKIIKLLKDESTEIVYEVITNNKYTATAKSTIILKTNIYYKVDGTWIKAKLYKKDTTWKRTKLYFKIENEWRNTK